MSHAKKYKKHIRVLVDSREAVRNKSGIGVVAKILTVQLAMQSKEECDIKFFFIKPSKKRFLPTKYGKFLEFIIWKFIYVNYKKIICKCDYVISFDCIGSFFLSGHIPIVHDLIFLSKPQWTDTPWGKLWRKLLPVTLPKSIGIIVPSCHTRDDIDKFFPGLSKKIPVEVVPWGSPNISYDKIKGLKKSNKFLFVGNSEPRRNLDIVIDAISAYNLKSQVKVRLIIVGNTYEQSKIIINRIKKNGIEKYVDVLGYVSDECLHELYITSIAYIYPSLYEGFGLTVLEAMSKGIPVITSNTTSLIEVAKGAAITINPESKEDITNAIGRIVSDKKLREDLVCAGFKCVKKFKWDNSAKQIVNFIRHLHMNREIEK